jgi:succinoglycan biosynthesis protein ExoM
MKRGDQKSLLNDKIQITSNILCSVCIATYQRPQLLEKLLRSLENQSLPKIVSIEIIVVDNDVNKSAEFVVRNFQNTTRIQFFYFNEPVKNISLARNLSVEKAIGEYILFIDDDEVASPQWVGHLLNALSTYNADGVFGQVLPKFNPQTPRWMKKGDFFFIRLPVSGTKATHKYTTNCLIKAALLTKMEEPFNPKYGLTGGEDTDLFNKLASQGARFVYCQEAVTVEYLPPERTRLSFLFLRRIKFGAEPVWEKIESAGRNRIFVRLFLGVKALCYGMISLICMIILFPSKVQRMQWFLRLGVNIGRLLAVSGRLYQYQWYR